MPPFSAPWYTSSLSVANKVFRLTHKTINTNHLYPMKRNFLLLVLCACCSTLLAQDNAKPTSYVNPFIGTGGHGHVFLGANVPFGFVQLGPTEPKRGWDWCSGYHYSDSVLLGFSHTHLSGTGCGDLGDVTFLPVANTEQRHTTFSHADEKARPGYYSVKLRNPDVRVELTATQRVGMHRYTFGATVQEPLLMLNQLTGIGWDQLTGSWLKQESPTRLSGFRRSHGWANDQHLFFVAEFSQPVSIKQQLGDSILFLAPTNTEQPLIMKVAFSPVSTENALMNMQAELPGWNFGETVRQAEAVWNQEMERVSIETTDEQVKRIFYTAFYHTMTAPSVYCDVNGDYRGSDNKIYRAQPGDKHTTNYTTLSLWDTYRALHPLMTLIHPDKQADIAETFIRIFNEQGKLPIWHLMGNETNCMVGSPAIPVLADLVLKGFVEDRETAFQAMKKSALLDERSLGLIKEYGFIPYDKEPSNETVAKALENALAFSGIAKVAKALGHKNDYRYFYDRSQLYRRLFDPQTHFMRALGTDGKFREPFEPIRVIHRADDYTEGNAWQYTFLVPHDPHGLVKLFGSYKKFAEKLDSLFIVEGELGDEASPDISGLIGQYAHGNEPSHHIIYMYNYIGQPWKAAQRLREVMHTMYFDDPNGLSGNEDVGQMSAWYMLSALGLYQVEPSGGKFVFGSPIIDRATLRVGNGQTFTIKTINNSPENIYIQSVSLNGKPYIRSYINFADIANGGTLEFTMGDLPSRFGFPKKDRP